MKSGNYCSKGVQKVARTLQDLLTISTPQIIVTEYHNGRAGQIRPKNTLTAGIEAVAICQCKDWLVWMGCTFHVHDDRS